MFDKLTKDAIETLLFARKEAARMGHSEMGTGHILLALILQGGIVGQRLSAFGIGFENTSPLVEMLYATNAFDSEREILFSVSAKLVLEQSFQEAQKYGHDFIDPQHIFLGMLHQRDKVDGVIIVENLTVDSSELFQFDYVAEEE